MIILLKSYVHVLLRRSLNYLLFMHHFLDLADLAEINSVTMQWS